MPIHVVLLPLEVGSVDVYVFSDILRIQTPALKQKYLYRVT